MEKAARFTPRQLLLIDAAGAFTTATLLSVLLANYETFFGMPSTILYPLAVAAACMGIYGLSCGLFFKQVVKSFLKPIIVANISYCTITMAVIFLHWEAITIYGLAYFAGDITIVTALVIQEYKTLTSKQ